MPQGRWDNSQTEVCGKTAWPITFLHLSVGLHLASRCTPTPTSLLSSLPGLSPSSFPSEVQVQDPMRRTASKYWCVASLLLCSQVFSYSISFLQPESPLPFLSGYFWYPVSSGNDCRCG